MRLALDTLTAAWSRCATTKKDMLEIEAELRALTATTMVLWGTADGVFALELHRTCSRRWAR